MAQMRGHVVMIANENRWPTPLAASRRDDLTYPYIPLEHPLLGRMGRPHPASYDEGGSTSDPINDL